MAYTMIAYLNKMQKARADLPKVIGKAVQEATEAAVQATAAATPPKDDTGRRPYIGANMVTGALKQAWATDSITKPHVRNAGGGYISFVTSLRNNQPYASYVNNGHRLKRHFVPGLYIDPCSGLLERDPGNTKIGLIVGTKTQYVRGEFMVDKGKEAYQKKLEDILGVTVKELLTR